MHGKVLFGVWKQRCQNLNVRFNKNNRDFQQSFSEFSVVLSVTQNDQNLSMQDVRRSATLSFFPACITWVILLGNFHKCILHLFIQPYSMPPNTRVVADCKTRFVWSIFSNCINEKLYMSNWTIIIKRIVHLRVNHTV